MAIFNKKGVSPVIAIVLLLMMTVAAAGAAYFWLTSMQSRMQESSRKSIENIMQKSGRRLIAQGAICEPRYHEGLVGWWKMDEGSGDEVHDSSGEGNDGTLEDRNTSDTESPQGPIWVNGKIGKALRFDGVDDYVFIGHPAVLSGLNQFTFTAWIRPEKPWDYATFLGKAPNGGSGEWLFNGAAGEELTILIIDQSEGTNSRLTGSTVLQEDTWYHVAAVYDKSDTLLQLCVNGKLDAENTSVVPQGIEDTSDDVRICGQGGALRPFNGTVDDVRVYDRPLPAGEIKAASQKNGTYMRVKVTVRNVGTKEVPEAKFVANLKKDGTTVDSDTYVTKSSIDTGDLKTLTFYFNEMSLEANITSTYRV